MKIKERLKKMNENVKLIKSGRMRRMKNESEDFAWTKPRIPYKEK